jgi:integrase
VSSSEITGSLVVREGKRGTVIYAKLRTPEAKWIRLGKLWTGKGRPAAGYLTRAQAEVRLDAIKHGDDPIVNVQPAGALFSEAVDEWLSDRGRELRPSTMHDYRGVAKTLRSYFAEKTLDAISTDDVNAFREHLLDQGRSARTTNKILTLLHGVFKLAMERGTVTSNPVAVARKAKQGRRKLGQYLQASEVLLLAQHAPTPQERVLYEVAAWTGLRWGELRALRWGDVRFSDSIVYVNRNWPVHGSEGETKSGKPRAVPLWDQAAMPLARLRDREHFTADDDYVFCQETGEPLGYDWTIRRFKAARDAAKLTSPRAGDEPLTFHDLRHTYGTLAAAIYKDLRRVQQFMGHASITTTEIYAHFLPAVEAASQGTAGLTALLSTDPSTNGAIPAPTGAN